MDLLNPTGWAMFGFVIFWLILAYFGGRIWGIRGLFSGRFNPGNWLENLCIVLAAASLVGSVVMEWLTWLARIIPQGIYNGIYSFGQTFGWW